MMKTINSQPRIPRSKWRAHVETTLAHAGVNLEHLPSGGYRIRSLSGVLCLSDLIYLTGPELRSLVRDTEARHLSPTAQEVSNA